MSAPAVEKFEGIWVGDPPPDLTEAQADFVAEKKAWEELDGVDDALTANSLNHIAIMAQCAIDRAEEVHAEVEKADDFQVGVTAYLQSLQAKVIELNATVEGLLAGGTSTSAPVVTERFMHKQTTKGWRLDESSVTIDWKGATPDPVARASYLRESFFGGNAEAAARNFGEPEE